jgi:hypothetical protein
VKKGGLHNTEELSLRGISPKDNKFTANIPKNNNELAI